MGSSPFVHTLQRQQEILDKWSGISQVARRWEGLRSIKVHPGGERGSQALTTEKARLLLLNAVKTGMGRVSIPGVRGQVRRIIPCPKLFMFYLIVLCVSKRSSGMISSRSF